MPTLDSLDVVEVTMNSTLQSSRILNVMHYVYTGPQVTNAFYAAELAAVGLSFLTKVWNPGAIPLRDRFSTDFVLNSIRVQPVDPIRKYYVDVVSGLPGTIATPAAPANDQITVSFQTDRARRGATGNKRFCGLPAAQLDGDTWSFAAVASWQTASAKLLLNLDGLGAPELYRPTVWSRRRAGDRSVIINRVVRPEVRITYSRTKGRGI